MIQLQKLVSSNQLSMLMLKLKAKKIATVGQFAQLSEHDVQLLPIKQPNRLERARVALNETVHLHENPPRPAYLQESPLRPIRVTRSQQQHDATLEVVYRRRRKM